MKNISLDLEKHIVDMFKEGYNVTYIMNKTRISRYIINKILKRNTDESILIKYIIDDFNKGISIKYLSYNYNLSEKKIEYILEKQNILNYDDIVNSYLNGESITSLRKRYNKRAEFIKRILLKNNVKIRTDVEATRLYNKTNSYDENYFSKYSDTMFYYVGLLMADGCVSSKDNGVCINLQLQDKSVLDGLREEIGLNKEIKVSSTRLYNNIYDVAVFNITSKQIHSDLIKLGVVPRKTYVGTTMKFIPDEYKIPFLYGFFDGDGYYQICKNGNHKIRLGSYTTGILEEIQKYLSENFGISSRIGVEHNLNIITFPKTQAIKLSKLFLGCNNKYYICRKREKLETLSNL